MNTIFKKAFFVLSFILCIIFIILQVVILNYDSTNGRQFDKISRELKEIEIANSLLSQKVASASSMLTIVNKAKLLGFNSKKAIVSLYSPQPLAAIQNTL